MKEIIIIFGPPAVGKMTVGQEVCKLNNYALLYNHKTIDLVEQIFEFGSEHFNKLNRKIRIDILKEVAKSNLKGIVLTKNWRFNVKEDNLFISQILKIFEETNSKVFFIELEADIEIRVTRNKTENRLSSKPTMINQSKEFIYNEEDKFISNTTETDNKLPNHIKINNSHLSAEETAKKIIKFIAELN